MQADMIMKYNVDMVFCIDATGSMKKVIDMVKDNALNFYRDVVESMENAPDQMQKKSINTMRIRVVIYRDYKADHDMAMMTTRFFKLPEEEEQFRDAINSVQAHGGGDEPEDGLEALAYAIRSDWNKEGIKKRNIIVVWTDASTHPIGYGSSDPAYPGGMPRSFSELTEWWGDEQMESPFINDNAKRLILFAPERPAWTDIVDSWNNVIHYPSVAGEGMEEFTYREIIDAIYNSI